MEIVVGLIIVAIVLFWLASRSSRRRKQEPGKTSTPTPVPSNISESVPTPVGGQGTVALRTFELWGSRHPNFEVVGEAYRRDAFRKIYKKRSLAPGQEFYGEAVLIPEQGNVHDASAVRVDVDDIAVGYLPREDASRYRPVLDNLFERGRVAVTPVRVWATNADGTWRARVTITLGDPSEIVPANEPPGGDIVEIPPNSRTVQVTGEEHHTDALAPYARGEHTSVWVSLHGIEKPGSRNGLRVVEVRVDGQRCGFLSPVTSIDLLPVIDRLEASGKLAVARASVRGNSLKADVRLDVMRAGDLNEEWIADNLN